MPTLGTLANSDDTLDCGYHRERFASSSHFLQHLRTLFSEFQSPQKRILGTWESEVFYVPPQPPRKAQNKNVTAFGPKRF